MADKKYTQEQLDKAVAKATAAEQKRCVAAVKAASADAYDASMHSKDFVRGAKQGLSVATKAIKAVQK